MQFKEAPRPAPNTFPQEDYHGILGQIVGDDRVVGEEIFVVGWQYHLQSRLQNRKSSLRFGTIKHSIEGYIRLRVNTETGKLVAGGRWRRGEAEVQAQRSVAGRLLQWRRCGGEAVRLSGCPAARVCGCAAVRPREKKKEGGWSHGGVGT
nr:hypothetical protein Iba_chr13aCG9910 [Ipomoea batatas]